MRGSLIAGIVLVLLGAFLLLRGGSFSTRRDVITVGDVKVTASDDHAVPAWVAGIAVVAGLVLVVSGVQRRT